jgi:glycosyltransferase involved in cell wall biosynthesis
MKLFDRLDRTDFDQRILITGQPDDSGDYLLPPREYPCTNLLTPKGISRASYQRRLNSFFAEHEPCVFLPNFDFDACSVTGLLSKNVAVCAGIRSDEAIYYRYAQTFGSYWDSAITVSQYLYQKFILRFPELKTKLAYIPNGVRLPPALSLAVKDPFKIIYCNRIDQSQKRIFDVLDIASRLRKRNVHFFIEVLGSGPDEVKFQKQIESRRLQSYIKFRGRQPHSEVIKALETATFFLLPSAYEGMPNSLLEAMAAGVVPFAYDISSGVPEIIQNGVNGYLFKIGDTRDISAKLEAHLLDPGSTRLLAANAREKIRQSFSVDSMAASYGEQFQSLGKMAADSLCMSRDGRVKLLESPSILSRIKRRSDPRRLFEKFWTTPS